MGKDKLSMSGVDSWRKDEKKKLAKKIKKQRDERKEARFDSDPNAIKREIDKLRSLGQTREAQGTNSHLKKKIDGVAVVDLEQQPQFDVVKFGAIVTVVDDDDAEKVWRLVDKEESDPNRRRISVQSPIGRSLLGKRVGDYVEVVLPKGKMGYEVLHIRYGAGEP